MTTIKKPLVKKVKYVYLAYTKSPTLNYEPTFLQVYGHYDRAFDWLYDIATRHGVRVHAGDGSVSAQVAVTLQNGEQQIWWLDKQEVK